MPTDRTLLKEQEQGAIASEKLVVNPAQAIIDAHSHNDAYLKTGTENAATNVGEVQIMFVKRQGLTRSVTIIPAANVANDNTNNVLFTVSARVPPAYNVATVVATYNTSTQQQGAMVAFTPATCAITAANAQIAATGVLTLTITKGGTGQVVPPLTTVHPDIEEN